MQNPEPKDISEQHEQHLLKLLQSLNGGVVLNPGEHDRPVDKRETTGLQIQAGILGRNGVRAEEDR